MTPPPSELFQKKSILGEPVVPYQLRVLDARDATTHIKRGQLEPIFTKILLHKKRSYRTIFLQTTVSVHSSSLVSSGSLTKVISDGLAFCQTQHPAFCPSDLPPPLSLLHNKQCCQTAQCPIHINFFQIKSFWAFLSSKISFSCEIAFWKKTKLIRHSVRSGLKFRLKASSADTLTEES